LRFAVLWFANARAGATLQQDVTFQSGGDTLVGVLHVPDGLAPGERRPAVIMMHGFGANRNGGPAWVCGQLEAWGYVALRFDFRGCGDSGGERGRVIPMEEVTDARNAVTYMASRPEVDTSRIALAGSSLGAGVAVHAAGVDERVAAVILENAVANGERTIRGMHTPDSWERFVRMMEDGLQAQARGEAGRKVHRFEIFEMPKHLQVNLASNNSLMEFSADTPAAFFMFRPEDMIGRIGPRPILILHSAGDRVCTADEAFSLARLAKPPVELHLMDGANHFLFVDADPRVAFMLRNWLDRFFPVDGAGSGRAQAAPA
jgi:pimeloyl-ACP methyl ester carboxylesterase